MKEILKGIIKENPIFVLILGLCSSLAVTTTFENAYMMGLCLTVVLIFTNVIVSCIRKIVPEDVKLPVFILIISTIVTILELLIGKYLPLLNESFGIYLPLIVVNCIVLGRTLSVASKSNVKTSFKDAIKIGLGYALALCLIALVREVLGSNTITLMDKISTITGYRAIYKVFPDVYILPMSVFITPAGAFLTLGLLSALFNKLKEKVGAKNESH